MTDLSRRINDFIKPYMENRARTYSTCDSMALSLLKEAVDAIAARDEVFAVNATVIADRDAAWRVAHAAAEGHAATRRLHRDIAESLEASEFDSPADIAGRLTAYVDRQTRNISDELDRTIIELNEANAKIEAERQSFAADRAELNEHILMVSRQRELNVLKEESSRNIANELKTENTTLKSALTMAGAPTSGDLTAWASNNRNTIVGLKRDIHEAGQRLLALESARRSELDEMSAACADMPFPFVPRDLTPIGLLMKMRDAALALHEKWTRSRE